MKKKFIRIISPITCSVIAALDCAILCFAVFSAKRLLDTPGFASIIFAFIEIFAIIIAILVTKEILKNGIVFYEDRLEFTSIDENNIFAYSEIAEIETYNDTKASLSKNFIDRHSLIIITLNDDTVTTVDIGLTSKKVLTKFKKELAEHISNDKIKN